MKTIILCSIFTVISCLSVSLNAQGCTGTYDNGYGKIHFVQNGNSVTATYDDEQGVGQFYGTMNGNILYGTWRDPSGTGNIRFEFTSDFSSFEAWWGHNDGPLNNHWARANRITESTKPINCFSLFHLGLLVGGLETGAESGFNSTWMTRTIDFALNHVEASNCIDDSYLRDLRSRIQGFSNTNTFVGEIRAYKARLIREVETSCACCLNCVQ